MGETQRFKMARSLQRTPKTMLFVFCYLLVQVESEELASTELSAALTENAKLRDENKRLQLACPACNAVNGARQRVNLELGEEETADPSEFLDNAKASLEVHLNRRPASNAVNPSQASNAAELIGDALRESAKKSSRRRRRKKEETANSSQPAASTAALTSADVKCRGNAQNQTQLKGTLDCESNPMSNKAVHKGSACLDNLSSGKYYNARANGVGQCRPFNNKGAFASITIQDQTSNQSRSGLVTKAFVAHPNKGNRAVGVFGFKRVLCNKNGGQCATFKNAVCIKCPEPIFASIYEVDATMEEKSKFIDCCVLGHKQYQVPRPPQNGKKEEQLQAMGITKEQLKAMKEPRDCPASMRGTGAFTARNDAAAGLKEAYKCSEYDADKARTLVSSA